jgi:hypothetical protein
MAGLPSAISQVLSDDVLTFLNRAHKVYLKELPLTEVNAHYTDVFFTLAIEAEPTVILQAATFTRGYPYLLQLMGYNLLEFT